MVEALAEQQDELTGLLDDLDGHEWGRPTPCEGWDVADVVLHLCQTNEMAIASADGRLAAWFEERSSRVGPIAAADVDAGAAAIVAAERGATTDALRERWVDGATTLRDRFAAGDPHLRVDWVAGQMSLRTLATTRLAETWIHTGDVAAALDVELVPGERLSHIARLAWRTLPYAFARAGRELAGPVAFELTGPTGAAWSLQPEEPAATTIRGDGVELCQVAGRRVDPASTNLTGEGPDVAAVLELVRTYA